MRKIILQNMISADGYFEGPLRDISWHRVDGEYNQYAIEFLNEVDTLIFGRFTYDLMKGYWSRQEVIEEDAAIANRINAINKIVFSRTLKSAGWSQSKLVTQVSSEEISTWKKAGGKHLAMFGSSNLALSFIHEQLIDEIRLIINPIMLGSGEPPIKGLKEQIDLELISSRVFESGNILACYRPLYRPNSA